jgi:hypothetical protein
MPSNKSRIPLGSYFSFLRVKSESLYCPEDERSKDVNVTKGECENIQEDILANVPLTSISGNIIAGNAQGKTLTATEIPNLTPGVVYAILFKGLNPEDVGGRFPVGFAATTSGGTYTFTDIIPGEYHIVFKSLDSNFSPEKVSVTVIGSDPATAPNTTISNAIYKHHLPKQKQHFLQHRHNPR